MEYNRSYHFITAIDCLWLDKAEMPTQPHGVSPNLTFDMDRQVLRYQCLIRLRQK